MATKAFIDFLSFHYKDRKGMRLGQHFCNLYIKKKWPELFYGEDKQTCFLIQDWLNENGYVEELPQPLTLGVPSDYV